MVFDNKYLVRWFQEAEKYASEHGLGVHEWEFLVGFYTLCLRWDSSY
jgi:hypothetical protein